MGSLSKVKLVCLTALLLGGLPSLSVLAPAAGANEVLVAQTQPQTRLRVAVLDFEFASTGLTGGGYSYFGDVGPSQGVSNLLTNKLVQSGAFTVIERSQIEAVLREQNLGLTGRLDPSTAAEVGRILGADLIILGSITRFNLEESQSGGSFLGFGRNSTSRGAVVQLSARAVDTTTAEIVAAAEGNGAAERGGGGVSTPFGSFGGSSSSDDEILSEAAEAAVTQLMGQLTSQIPVAANSGALPTVEALVADVAGGTIVINRGSQDGFRTGMMLSIERVDREVTDPTTGEVIRTITVPVGQIELTEVDARSGVGRVVSGSGFEVGDRARAAE